jgi:hypothetical protein
VGFRSLQENIDTTTPGGNLIFHIIGAPAEFERTQPATRPTRPSQLLSVWVEKGPGEVGGDGDQVALAVVREVRILQGSL